MKALFAIINKTHKVIIQFHSHTESRPHSHSEPSISFTLTLIIIIIIITTNTIITIIGRVSAARWVSTDLQHIRLLAQMMSFWLTKMTLTAKRAHNYHPTIFTTNITSIITITITTNATISVTTPWSLPLSLPL